jgi:hypothetical protein
MDPDERGAKEAAMSKTFLCRRIEITSQLQLG